MPNLGNIISASFWFLPLVVVTVAAAAALGLVQLEAHLGEPVTGRWPLVLNASPETARSFLAALAATVATIAATTFSLTIVALTLAAQQYTPKVLHNYLASRGSQITLGVLAGTFAYAILVLQAVRSEPGGVPALAFTGALVLALASIGLFLYFLHHIATSLQGASIAADIEQRTLRAIERAFATEAGAAGAVRDDAHTARVPVRAEGRSGYVQLIELDELVQLAAEHDVVLTVERGPGTFVPQGAALASLSPPERVSPTLVRQVCAHVKLGSDRTHQQDVAFGVYQLVDIAVRSLSPSFNAITTAATCIDHLDSILRQLARLDLPSWRCFERDGTTRVMMASPTFDDLLELAFAQIRTSGASHRVILIHLLDVIAGLEELTVAPERRRRLVEHANHLAAAAERGIQAEVDREAIRARLRDVGARLQDVGVVEVVGIRARATG